MRRTAHLIEEQKAAVNAQPSAQKPKKKPRGKPFEKGNKFAYQPGESGNPGGLPGTDLAAQYARRFFEQNPQGISAEMAEGLKGFNAYAYGVLADRAYGKVAEKRINEITGKDGGPVEITIKFVKPDA